MVGKFGKQSMIGFFFILIVLVLTACRSSGGKEPAVGNVGTANEAVEAAIEQSDATTPATDDASDNATVEPNGKRESDDEDLAGSETNGEEMESGENPGDGEESEQDDRPEGFRLATAGWNTNWERHTVDYQEFLSGGPPRDGIRSIDDPAFENIDTASVWLAGNEPVIALEIDGDARAYPLQILIWHEIVNDTVGEVPVIVTFCPLCNSALVFDRRLDGEIYEFGTSGLLRNSDLVMYHRTTETLW